MSSTKGKNDPGRKENDLYETPKWCIDILDEKVADYVVRRHRTGEGLQIVDVGAGDGRIGLLLKSHFPLAKITLIDIVEPPELIARWPDVEWIIDDYLNLDLDKVVTEDRVLFVGNPPFSLATEIVFKTVSWMKKFRTGINPSLPSAVVFLLRLNWLGSERRAEWVGKNPPDRLTVLAPRPSFCVRVTVKEDGTVKKSSNDSCEYAWMWWETDRWDGPFVEVGVWRLSPKERRKWKAEQRRKK